MRRIARFGTEEVSEGFAGDSDETSEADMPQLPGRDHFPDRKVRNVAENCDVADGENGGQILD